MPDTADLATLDDDALSAALARSAGALLLALRAARPAYDDSVLRRRGDRDAHEHLLEQLAAARPGDAVLSEEGADDAARLRADRVWIIDPLDGTREFGERDRDDWAVHVAVWVAGELAAGAVALPARGVVLHTGAGGVPPLAALGRRPRLLVSRTRPSPLATDVAERLGAELISMGSAGAKAMAVVRGHGELYLHSGGQYEWDSAAPVAVARRAGLHTSRLDGSPLRYNQPDPRLPDLLIARPELAEAALRAVVDATAQRPG